MPAPAFSEQEVADICASFQRAVVEALLDRTFDAAGWLDAKSVGIAGGVSANSRLRADAIARGEQAGIPVFVPSLALTTDNAAMIAAAGLRKRLHAGRITAGMDLNAQREPSAMSGPRASRPATRSRARSRGLAEAASTARQPGGRPRRHPRTMSRIYPQRPIVGVGAVIFVDEPRRAVRAALRADGGAVEPAWRHAGAGRDAGGRARARDAARRPDSKSKSGR